jgi:hypothetical protein
VCLKHEDSRKIYNPVKAKNAVFQPEKSIRGEPVESCNLRYFNSFEFFYHSVLQKHTEKEFTMN